MKSDPADTAGMDETVGARVQRIAKARRGWTLAQLATHLGVSYETARKWVVGETAPNRNRVKAIALLLEVTAEEVLFGERAQMALTPEEVRMVMAFRSLKQTSEGQANPPPDPVASPSKGGARLRLCPGKVDPSQQEGGTRCRLS